MPIRPIQYELSNPSDPYTFVAANREVAALTVLCLSTALGAKAQGSASGSDVDGVPIFIFGGAEEWYQETFGRTVKEGIDALASELGDSLDSFMLGHFEDRRRYEAALAAIDDPEKRRSFMAEWQDGCSSMNDIGGIAHKYAANIRANIAGA